MPQSARRQQVRGAICKRYLYGLVAALLLIPGQGSSWDEPSEPSFYLSPEADILLLLSGDGPMTVVDSESAPYQGPISDSFLNAAASKDCIDLWRAYVHAIVQVELAQANVAKIQAAIEKCLEKRNASAAFTEPLPSNAFIGSDDFANGELDVELGADAGVSILD